MHPVNYDITVRTKQLEIEHALRSQPPYAEFMSSPEKKPPGPRRVDILMGHLARFFSPARNRRVHAD